MLHGIRVAVLQSRHSREIGEAVNETSIPEIRRAILTLRELLESGYANWSTEEAYEASCCANELRRAKLDPCAAQEEIDRLLTIYEPIGKELWVVEDMNEQ